MTRRVKPSGFTMIELMMAIVIFFLALGPLLNLFGSSHKGTVMTVNLATAKNLASDVGEFVRTAPFDSFDETYLNEVFPTLEGVPPLPAGFTRKVTVVSGRHDDTIESDVVEEENNDMPVFVYRVIFDYKTVETIVSWTEGGEKKEFSLSSIVVQK